MVGWEDGFVWFCCCVCVGGGVWFGFVLFYIPEPFCSSKCISLAANTIGVSPLHFWLMLAEDLHDYTQPELNHKLLHLRRSFPCRSPSILTSAAETWLNHIWGWLIIHICQKGIYWWNKDNLLQKEQYLKSQCLIWLRPTSCLGKQQLLSTQQNAASAQQKKVLFHLRQDADMNVHCPNNFPHSKGTAVWWHGQQLSDTLLCSHTCPLPNRWGKVCCKAREQKSQDSEADLQDHKCLHLPGPFSSLTCNPLLTPEDNAKNFTSASI